MCALNATRRWLESTHRHKCDFSFSQTIPTFTARKSKATLLSQFFYETFEFIGYSENELRELILRLDLYAFDKFSRGNMIGYTDVYFNKEKFHPSEPAIIRRELLPKCQVLFGIFSHSV